jgi:prevent-host-death family protein
MPVSVREFKANLSRYLSEARAGRTVEVTSHRKVIARVSGVPDESDSGAKRLVALGAARWEGGKPEGDEIRLEEAGRNISEVVMDQRG